MTRAVAAPTGRLAELIEIVDDGLDTYVRVGSALAEIRDDKLYKVTHTTFEAFCEERWSFSSRQARRLIDAADVAEKIGPIGPLLPPKNEAQARELAPLLGDPPAMAEAWREAQAAPGPITAAKVREVVRGHVQASMPGVERDLLPKASAPWRATPGCDACRAIEQTARSHDYVAHDGARPAVIDITPLVVSEGFGLDDVDDIQAEPEGSLFDASDEGPETEPIVEPEPAPAPKARPGPISDGVNGLPVFGYGRRAAGPLTKAAQAGTSSKRRGMKGDQS